MTGGKRLRESSVESAATIKSRAGLGSGYESANIFPIPQGANFFTEMKSMSAWEKARRQKADDHLHR